MDVHAFKSEGDGAVVAFLLDRIGQLLLCRTPDNVEASRAVAALQSLSDAEQASEGAGLTDDNATVCHAANAVGGLRVSVITAFVVSVCVCACVHVCALRS